MKTLIAATTLILIQGCLTERLRQRLCARLAAASVLVESYIKALTTSNIETARRAFHKDARLVGVNRAGYYFYPIEDWMKNLKGTPNADEALHKRIYTIIDLTPIRGVAKVVLVYPNATFLDHMALLKIDGEWKIVQKPSRAVRLPAK